MIAAMGRDGAVILSDLVGKLDARCSQCGRDGCCGLSRLSISVAAMANSLIGSMN